MSEDLGVAYGTVIINTAGALASLAALRAQTRSGVEALNTIGRSAIRAGVGIMGFGAVIVAAFALAVNKTAELEKKMSFIKGITNMSQEQINLVREKALMLGQSSAFTATQVADGFIELSKAGATSTEILGGMGDAMITLGQSADIALDVAAQTLISIRSQFGLLPKDSAHIADVVQGAANASIISVQDMIITMKYAGGIAHILGLSLEETAAAIAMIGNAGIKGSTAGTSLRRIFMQLSPHTKKATSAMKALGIITKDGTNRFYDAAGGAKKLSEISEILYQSTKNLSKKDKKDYLSAIFLDRATPTAIALAEGGAKSFDKFYKAVTNTKAADVAAERLNNLAGAWRIFKGSVETAMVRLGTPAQVPLTNLVKNLTKLVRAFANLSPKTQQFIVKALLLVAAISVATGGFLIFFGTILRVIAIVKELQIFLLFLKGMFLGLSSAGTVGGALVAIFSPVVLVVLAVVAAVAALVAMFVTAYKRSAALRKAISDMHDTLMKNLAPAIKWVKDEWKKLAEEWKKFTSGAGDKMATAITLFTDSLLALIDGFNGVESKQKGFVGFFNGFGRVLSAIFLTIRSAIFGLIDGFLGLNKNTHGVRGIFNKIGQAAKVVATFLVDAFYKIRSGIFGFIDGLKGVNPHTKGFRGAMNTLAVFLKNTVVKAFYFVRSAIFGLIDGFKGINKDTHGVRGFFNTLGQWAHTAAVFVVNSFNNIKEAIGGFIKGVSGNATGKETGVDGFFVKIGTAVKDFIQNTLPKIKTVLTGVKDAILGFVTGLTGNATGKEDGVGGFFTRIGTAVRTFITDIVPKIQAVFGGIADAIDSFTSGAKGTDSKQGGPLGFFNDLGLAVRYIVENVVPAIQNVFSTIKDAITGFATGWSAVMDGIPHDLVDSTIGKGFQLLGAILAKIVPLFSMVWDVIKNQVWPALQELGQSVKDALIVPFQELWATLKTQLGPALKELWDVIQNELWPALKLLWEELKPLLKILGIIAVVILGVVVVAIIALLVAFAKAVALVIKFGAIIVETVINIVKPIIDILVSIITGAIEIITGIIKVFAAIFNNDWQGLWDGIVMILKGAWDIIAGVFTGAWNIIWAILEGFVKMVVGWFQSLFDTLVGHSIVPDMINAIVEWFRGLPGKVIGFIGGMVTEALSAFGSFATQALTVISGFVVTFVDWFLGLPEKVGSALATLISGILGWAPGFFTAAQTLGQNIVDGVMGIVSGLGDLVGGAVSSAIGHIGGFIGDAWNAAWAFGDSIWQGFKGGMGINSPSNIEKAMYQVTRVTGEQLTLVSAGVSEMNRMVTTMEYPVAPGFNVTQTPNSYNPKSMQYDGQGRLVRSSADRTNGYNQYGTNDPKDWASMFGKGGPGGKMPDSPDVVQLKGILLQLTLMANMIQTIALASQNAKLAQGLNTASLQTITGQVVALAGLSMRLATTSQAAVTLSGASLQSLREIERLTAINGPKPAAPVAPRPVVFSIGTVQDGDSLLRRARATDRMLSLAEGGDSSQQQGLGI